MVLYNFSAELLWSNPEMICLLGSAISSAICFMVCLLFFLKGSQRGKGLTGTVLVLLLFSVIAITGYVKHYFLLCLFFVAILYWRREKYDRFYPFLASLILFLFTLFLGLGSFIEYSNLSKAYHTGGYNIVEGAVEQYEQKGEKELFIIEQTKFYNLKKRYGYCKEKTGAILRNGMQVKIYYVDNTILYIEQI